MDKDTALMGPVQMLVLGFEGDHFTGEILPELRRLKDADVIRMIDMLFVRKDAAGRDRRAARERSQPPRRRWSSARSPAP